MSRELIEKFERIGVTKDFLESRLGIDSYDIEEITKPNSLRSRAYRVNIVPRGGEPYSEIIKETWPGPSVSKRLWRGIPNKSIGLERNEIDFLRFATENKAYTPKLRWDKTIQDGDIERTFFGMSYNGKSSEILLSAQPEVTYDFTLRAIDKLLANAYIAKKKNYRTEIGGLPAIWSLDAHFIKSTVHETLENLIKYRFESFDNPDYIEWLNRYGFKNTLETLSNYLIKTLTKEPCEYPIPLTLHLGNILVGNKPIPPSYDSEVVCDLAKGEGDVSGDSIVITDYRRLGKGSEVIIEQFLRHPLMLKNLTEQQLDNLSEHIFIQYNKLRAIDAPEKYKNKPITKSWLNRDKSARRLAVLNKVNYNLGLNYNFPKKAEQRELIYEIKSHAKKMLTDFISVKDNLSKKNPEIDQAFRELMPNGS